MSKEKGIAHIIVLFIILLALGIIVLIFLGMQASKALNLTPNQTTQSENPFNQAASYENPFDDYQNPFDQIK